ncbi:MAG: CDP-diacylglycerol--serine O-phosphatidyltransferase [Burkholderiales bacterium]|jgi:CDP-diacylglycerol--serine O-phosphatidyltransferase|nr:CDP-diacylglycerol--serine O-phosphatidyltransferase [Burkholderiales bacterium]
MFEDDQKERILRKTRGQRRGIYFLPNLFTTASLFAGFFSIVQGYSGYFSYAAAAIFVAMVLDSLDGRVARMTKTQSPFGAEYDSLSDMVSFGVAPALLIYVWALNQLGKLGWLAAFVFVAGAALRLARFNTMLEVADKRWFIGLPSPAAAALVAGFVWISHDNEIIARNVLWLAWGVTLFAGITMISNIKYFSFKTINLRKSVPFMSISILVLVFALIAWDPPLVLFSCVAIYALSGFVIFGWLWWRERRRKD